MATLPKILGPDGPVPDRIPSPPATISVMLSPETLAEYRRMTPGQRLALALRMTDENLPSLLEGRPDVIERRFELLRRENDLRNHNMRVAMARTRQDS